MIQRRMTVLSFKVFIAVLISLCRAQSSTQSRQMTKLWTRAYENKTISTHMNDVNSSNTFPVENVTASIFNSSNIEDSIRTTSVVNAPTTNFSALEDLISNSSTTNASASNISSIENSSTNFSVIDDFITKSSVTVDFTSNSSVTKESIGKNSVIDDSITNSSITEDFTTNSSVIKDYITNNSVTDDMTSSKLSVTDFITTNSSIINDSITSNSVINDSITNLSVTVEITTFSPVINDSIINFSVIKSSDNNDSTTKPSIIENSVTNSSAIETHDYATNTTNMPFTTKMSNLNEFRTRSMSASLLLTSVTPEKKDMLLNDSEINTFDTTASINVSNFMEIKKMTTDKNIPEIYSAFNATRDDRSLNTSEYLNSIIELTTIPDKLNDSVFETETVANGSNLHETLDNTKVLDNIYFTNKTPVLNLVEQTTGRTSESTIAPISDADATTQGYVYLNNKTSDITEFDYVSTTIKFEASSIPNLRPITYAVEDVSVSSERGKVTSVVPISSVKPTLSSVKQFQPLTILSRISEQKTPENPPPIIVPHKSIAPELRLTARNFIPAKPTTLSPPPPPPIIIPQQAKLNIGKTQTYPLHRPQSPKPNPLDIQSQFPVPRELERIDLQNDTLKSFTLDKLKQSAHITAPILTQNITLARTLEADKRQTHLPKFSSHDFMDIQFFKPKNLLKDVHPTPRKSFFDFQPLVKRPDVGSLVNLTSFSQVFFKPEPKIFRSNPINEKRLGNIGSVNDAFIVGDSDKMSKGLSLNQSNKNIRDTGQMKKDTFTNPWDFSIAFGSKTLEKEMNDAITNAQPPSMPWDISSLNFNLNMPLMSTSKEIPKTSLQQKKTIISHTIGFKGHITNTPINISAQLPSTGKQQQLNINSNNVSATEQRPDFSSAGFKVNIPIIEMEQKGMTIKKDASQDSNMQHTQNVSASLKWNIPNLGVDWNVPAIRLSKQDKSSPDKTILEVSSLPGLIPLPPPHIKITRDHGLSNMSPSSSDVVRTINGQMDSEILPVGVWNFMNKRELPNPRMGVESQNESVTDNTKSTGILKPKLASMPEFKPLQLSSSYSGNSQSHSLNNVPVHYENQDKIQKASIAIPAQVPSTKNSRNIITKIRPIDWNISFMPTEIVSKPNRANSSMIVNPLKNPEANIFTQPRDRRIDESPNPVDKDVFSGQNTIQDLKPKTSSPLEPPPIFPFLTRIPTTQKPKTKDQSLIISSPSRRGNVFPNGKEGICDSCVFVNEVCFVPHDVHCNQYYECVSQGGDIHVYKRECAVGLFYNRTNFLCAHPDMTDCSTDRCRQTDVREYSLEGHCSYHWSCRSSAEGSYPEIRCCPNNGAFKEGEGCIEDSNCKESCSIDSVTTANNTKLQGPCSANLKMTFSDSNSDNIADISKNKQSVGVLNVATSTNGTALFYGTGKLTLWRFAHLMFGSVLAIQLNFVNKQNEPRYQILLTNCNPNNKDGNPSIEIRIDTLYHEVIFQMDTYQARQQRMKLHYMAGTWNTVTFIYDGERAVGAVNRRARSLLLEGGIETRPSPLIIGGCREIDSFRGEMDEIYVYEDCLPDNMISIFQSVLE